MKKGNGYRNTLIALIGLAVLGGICTAQKETLPPLKPKPYAIGIAPSHITTTADPLFAPGAPWQEVRGAIDFYKYYSLQLTPPDWATRLTAPHFVKFMKKHSINIGAEFGHFGFHQGKDQGLQIASSTTRISAAPIEAGTRIFLGLICKVISFDMRGFLLGAVTSVVGIPVSIFSKSSFNSYRGLYNL